MSYTCEWERPDSPTVGLSRAAMLTHYKDHSVAGWCRFYLENPGEESPELRAAIQALADSCERKQKPAHKVERDRLARWWQTEAQARRQRDVPAGTPYRPGHLTMYGWNDGAPPAPPKPKPVLPEWARTAWRTPTRRPVPRPLPVTPATVSFRPARIVARYQRAA